MDVLTAVGFVCFGCLFRHYCVSVQCGCSLRRSFVYVLLLLTSENTHKNKNRNIKTKKSQDFKVLIYKMAYPTHWSYSIANEQKQMKQMKIRKLRTELNGGKLNKLSPIRILLRDVICVCGRNSLYYADQKCQLSTPQ